MYLWNVCWDGNLKFCLIYYPSITEKDKTSAKKEENHKPDPSAESSSNKPTSVKTASNDSSISDNKMPPNSATSNAAVITPSSNNNLTSEVKNEARTSPVPTSAVADITTQGAASIQAQSLQDIEAQMLKSSGKVAEEATESAKTPADVAAAAETAATKTDVPVQEQKLPEAAVAVGGGGGGGAATGDAEKKAAVIEDEDDGLEHLEKAAESLMAELIEGVSMLFFTHWFILKEKSYPWSIFVKWKYGL